MATRICPAVIPRRARPICPEAGHTRLVAILHLRRGARGVGVGVGVEAGGGGGGEGYGDLEAFWKEREESLRAVSSRRDLQV